MEYKSQQAEEIKECPFCGGEATLILIGNDDTRKRSVEIKCAQCYTKQVTGAIYKSHDWCKETAIAKWNKRIPSHSSKEDAGQQGEDAGYWKEMFAFAEWVSLNHGIYNPFNTSDPSNPVKWWYGNAQITTDQLCQLFKNQQP